jgi:hypothetical protein
MPNYPGRLSIADEVFPSRPTVFSAEETDMRKLIVLLALSACGSGGETPFTPNTELAWQNQALPDGGSDRSSVLINIWEIDQGPQACRTLPDAGGSDNQRLTGPGLDIFVARLDGTPLAVGAYPIVPNFLAFDGGSVADLFMSTITSSAITDPKSGVSGTVNLTAVGSTFAGNYMAETIDGVGAHGMISGSFSAPLCGQ